MNRFLPADPPEVKPVAPEEPTRSAPAMVYALLANSSLNPLGLEDWLGEITKALCARLGALAALLDHEPVVQYFFSRETGRTAPVNWPWDQDAQSLSTLAKDRPAVPAQSVDGRSSFLTVAVEHQGVLWVLALEEAISRSWSVDEQAALTLAALSLFQFPSIQQSARRWAHWSEKARTQQRLEDAAAVVGRLAHDFNNVLTSVLGFTELSLAQPPQGGAQRKLMAEVYAAAQQGSQLTNQLSLFSTRRTAPQESITSLSFVLGAEAKRCQEAWGNAITLELLVPQQIPALSIDADSLRIILDRLLDNARAAISTTGTVTVSAREVALTREDCLELLGKACPGPYVEITVADSGCGFSADARRRILAEPFFSTKPRHRGLGLPSVYGLLMNYGGGIRLEHRREREPGASATGENGTLVRIYLPTPEPTSEAFAPALSANRACLLNQDVPSLYPRPAKEEEPKVYRQAVS
jgi:signal transduction histidine kinase